MHRCVSSSCSCVERRGDRTREGQAVCARASPLGNTQKCQTLREPSVSVLCLRGERTCIALFIHPWRQWRSGAVWGLLRSPYERSKGGITMTNPLRELEALGQSIWLDDIDRGDLLSGRFKRLIEEDGLAGATGNPTIFEHSITHDTTYDEQILQLIREGKSAQEIYEALAITDEQTAADLLRPVYEQTGGQDGFVSIEVSPYLAHNTDKTLLEVRRFWHTIERHNLMVKIPSTPAGLPAIRQALAEGININITLMFSLDNCRQVAEAYLSALEERLAAGKDINRIAYQEFKRLFSTPRFEALRQTWSAGTTSLMGQHGHEESSLPRCAVYRGIDRPQHSKHHATQNPRKLPRSRASTSLR